MLSHCLEGEGIRLKRDVNDVVRIFFSSAWQLKSSTWYLSGGKEIRKGVQGGGGAVSWSRFVDFAEQLSFCHTHGPIPLPSPVEAIAFSSGNDLLCFRLMTLMLIRMCLLHRLLVLGPSQSLLQSLLQGSQRPTTTLYCQSCRLCQTHSQLHLLVPAPQRQRTLTSMIFPGDLRS